MEIDEKQEKLDLSDHNLITVTMKRKDKGVNVSKTGKWEEYEYFKTDKDSLKLYKQEVERRLENKHSVSIETLNKILWEEANKTLKKNKIKVKGGGQQIEQPWITDEIKKSIKMRKE